MPPAERAPAAVQPRPRKGTTLPLVACDRCGASGRTRDAELLSLDDHGQPRPSSNRLAWVGDRMVEGLPPGPTAPCPVCQGQRLVSRRGHRPYARARPYASAHAARQAARRGTASTCPFCDGSGLVGWVAVWQSCSSCNATGRVLGWADGVDPVAPEEVVLDQPAPESFLASWLATATWTVTRTDPPPPRSRLARLHHGSDQWAHDHLVGFAAAGSLVSVWAPNAGW